MLASEDTKTLEFNQYRKSDNYISLLHSLEFLIEKNGGCKNNSEDLSTTKVREHIPSGFLMSIILSFKSIEYKHDVCRGKDCMKKFL